MEPGLPLPGTRYGLGSEYSAFVYDLGRKVEIDLGPGAFPVWLDNDTIVYTKGGVWRGAQPAPVLGVLTACRFPPGWPARRRRAASLAADVPSKCGSRVRLNGAGHQWGKDPPKEVVG